MTYKQGEVLQRDGFTDFQVEGMVGNIVLGYYRFEEGTFYATTKHINELKDWTLKTVKERWKPKKGETFWCVNSTHNGVGICEIISTIWNDDYIDAKRFKYGNYFRTKEECQAAADKVKELLLSLHEV